MLILSSCFLIYVIATIWYIHALHLRIKSYEENWNQIEKLTDHNRDGDIVIHIHHTEDQ